MSAPPPDSARFALLAHLVDYAGLFPPAALDLEPALRNHLAYRDGRDAWMLGRFIVPAARLGELAPFASRLAAGAPLRLSVLGVSPDEAGGPDLAAVLGATRRRVAAAERELAVRGDRFELRASAEAAGDAARFEREATDAAALLSADEAVAVEVPLVGDAYRPDAVAGAAHAVAAVNARAGRDAIALKFRCGGVTADAFPGVEALAAAIAACRDAGAPFKATAGLHHPVRHEAEAVGTHMHGFLNVFGGAVLAQRLGLDADALAEVLDETDPAAFRLAEHFAWQGHAADGRAVAQARATLALSYGSCSFDEPREDLRALDLL